MASVADKLRLVSIVLMQMNGAAHGFSASAIHFSGLIFKSAAGQSKSKNIIFHKKS